MNLKMAVMLDGGWGQIELFESTEMIANLPRNGIVPLHSIIIQTLTLCCSTLSAIPKFACIANRADFRGGFIDL